MRKARSTHDRKERRQDGRQSIPLQSSSHSIKVITIINNGALILPVLTMAYLMQGLEL